MTPDEFRAALAALGCSQRGFAAYTGSNERTVRRWALGEQDIPPWVPVLLAAWRVSGLPRPSQSTTPDIRSDPRHDRDAK